ncbi:hypothetical protein F4806DRAFT_491478 [Annulohypoxylon nitens]|nr:hypothetical protein F4806DRAFT_491478 [Annulohypoxylon nitens]
MEMDIDWESASLTTDPPLFPQFSELPPELQLLIWEAASELEEPGVCIPIPTPAFYYDAHPGNNAPGSDSRVNILDTAFEPLIVNFPLPPVFQVCRSSREVARKMVPHYEDDGGACYGAYRKFDPAKDLFLLRYIIFQKISVMRLLAGAGEIKHIGLEFPDMYDRWDFFLNC